MFDDGREEGSTKAAGSSFESLLFARHEKTSLCILQVVLPDQ